MCLKEYLKLVRFDHQIFLIIGVIVGELIVIGGLPPTDILVYSILTPVLIGMASFALNDLLDLPTDKKNKRKDRPLVTKKIPKWTATLTVLIGFPLGVILSYFVNITVFKIAIAFALLGFLYSVWLKKVAVVGNASIAASMAIPFIFGNYTVAPKMVDAVIILSTMAFMMGLGRELFKSIQDMKGDKKMGRKTLPIIAGKKTAAAFGAYFIIFSIFVSFLPFIYIIEYKFDLYYLIPIIVADILLISSAMQALKLKGWKKVRNWTLLAMLFGLVGFLAGALI